MMLLTISRLWAVWAAVGVGLVIAGLAGVSIPPAAAVAWVIGAPIAIMTVGGPM